MKKALTIAGLTMIVATIVVSQIQTNSAPPAKTQPSAESSKTNTVLGVEQFMKNVERYRGNVRVEGVVVAVSATNQMLGLIDVREFQTCGLEQCSLSLPVRWTGTMPTSGKPFKQSAKFRKLRVNWCLSPRRWKKLSCRKRERDETPSPATIHFVWSGMFPERNATQDRWQTVVTEESPSWLNRYLETQSYWRGYSYALSLAFVSVAWRRYREQRMCAARNLAVGGITLTGFLAFTGCFLIGCCGSPMLSVYLSLFGASFLPWAKPLIAGLTTVMIAASNWWMQRKLRAVSEPGIETNGLSTSDCGCRR